MREAKARGTYAAGFDQTSLNEIQRNILLNTLDTLRKRIDLHGGIDLSTNKEPKD